MIKTNLEIIGDWLESRDCWLAEMARFEELCYVCQTAMDSFYIAMSSASILLRLIRLVRILLETNNPPQTIPAPQSFQYIH